MAPVEEAFFPPLDRCLNGEHQLLSWRSTYEALSLPDKGFHNVRLKRYLQDPHAKSLLVECFAPFSPPTPQTKATFETKTSAINVTPSSYARYDIKQIQSDVSWLSKEATVDEVSALRIAVLEWQTRSAAQLLQGSDQDFSAHQSGESDRMGASLFEPGASLLANPSSKEKVDLPAFEQTESRHRRLLEIYLSERRFLLKTCEFLTFIALSKLDATPVSAETEESSWLQEVGANVLSAWSTNDPATGNSRKHPVMNAVDALQSRLESIDRGSGWLQSERNQDDVELAWARSHLTEMIHIMQITLNFLQAAAELVKSPAILSWFRFMRDCGFYEGLTLPNVTLQATSLRPLISLSALISLAIIDLPSALRLLGQSSTATMNAAHARDSVPYLLDTPTVTELNDILVEAAQLDSAGPSIMAWAILMSTLRESAMNTRESREVRQALRAADKYGNTDSSDTDGVERSSINHSSFRRRSSTGSDTSLPSTLLEEIYDAVSIVAVDGDPVLFLANNAVASGRLFDVIVAIAQDYCTPFGFEHGGKPGQDMRGLLLDLIRASLDFVEYQSQLLAATIAVLTGYERFWEVFDRSANFNVCEPAAVFLQDKFLKDKLFLVSMIQFPHQSMPFLQLCRACAPANDGTHGKPAVWDILEDVDSFTCCLPNKDYQAYVPIRTQEDADYIELTEPLIVSLDSSTNNLSRLAKSPPALAEIDHALSTHEIPPGSTGWLMNESKPFVVAWKQEYSALKYMGKVLRCASKAPNLQLSSNSFMSVDIVSEVVGLITNMLAAAVKSAKSAPNLVGASDSAQAILGVASDGLGRNQDIVSVILDIFERHLYNEQRPSEDPGSLDILVQCIQFSFVLLQTMPDRVWPFLGRSGLLGMGQDDSRLRAIVANKEVVLGRYDFLNGCIRLFDLLIDDYTSNVAYRKTPSKVLTRFGDVKSQEPGISPMLMERVLLNLTRIMIEVYESTAKWQFQAQESRREINFRLCSIFNKILRICFEFNDNLNISQKLIGALAPSAQYIVEVFLSSSGNNVTVLPILQILLEGASTQISTLPILGAEYTYGQVVAAIDLSRTLIKVNCVLDLPTSHLENEMFKASSVLARVYAAREIYKEPVLNLFHALVCSAAISSQQPASLLGHLGQRTSTNFLDVVSKLDQPLPNQGLSTAIWRLLAAVISKRQQWFAIFILTGETPRKTFQDKVNTSESSSRPLKPLLSIALETLSNIDKIEPTKALPVLEFVALAADFWPWVLGIIEKHSHFLKSISEFAAHVGSMTATTRENPYKNPNNVADYNRIQMASLIADILSMYTHYTQQMGNGKFAKMLVPHLTYLIKHAISNPSYNSSLHQNLRQNFEAKFQGCKLTDFKRCAMTGSQLGQSFYYDVDFANQLLSHEPAWMGRKGDDGFAEELKRANDNLSLVEAQVNLFHSWKSLLVELSGPLSAEPKFQKIMALATTDCLTTNSQNHLPEAVFERLAVSRATLGFTLLQRLLEVKSGEIEVGGILPVAWNTILTYGPNVGSALDGEDADYYRILLKILYLALQFHSSSIITRDPDASKADRSSPPPIANSATPIALEVISKIVSQGFRSLTIALHDDSSSAQPSDFVLLTAILRTCLQIPNVTRNTTRLLDAFADSQTARCASTLLSWADQLTTSGDPIFGELSISFLLEMSSVPSLAESLAVDGVLSHILSTNLIQALQSRSFGPFDQPARMNSIWTRGILPLLLNLLHVVGPPLGVEIAAALNTFPHQLEQASGHFASTTRREATKDYVTLSMTSEAVTLSLISTILQSFREAGPSAAVISSAIEDLKWDRTQVKDDVEELLQRRGSLSERIMPTNEREEVWSRAKPVNESSKAENRLEEKVAEDLENVLEILNGNGNGDGD